MTGDIPNTYAIRIKELEIELAEAKIALNQHEMANNRIILPQPEPHILALVCMMVGMAAVSIGAVVIFVRGCLLIARYFGIIS